MAKPKKPRKKPPKKPPRYSPTEVTSYPSEKAFNKTVETRAKAGLQPGLSDIRSRKREELGAHRTRNTDINAFYGQDLAARQAGMTRLNEALQGILGRQDVMGTDAQAGLAAALRQSQEGNAAAAQQLGVQAPGVDPEMAKVLAAYNKGGQMGLAGDFGAHLALGAADIGMTGIEQREAGERELGTHTANMRGLTDERTELMKTLPGLREGARSALMQEILGNSQNKLAWRQFGEGRRASRAQEDLARDQFGLAEDQFSESKRARRFDEKMARKQATLSEDQLQLARDELNAKIDSAATEEEMAAAEGQAKRFDQAAEHLSGYLAPGDADMKYNENGKKVFSPGKYKNRVNANKFHEVLTDLMTRYGLDRATAYQVMRTAPIFRKRAEKFADAWEMRTYGGPGHK